MKEQISKWRDMAMDNLRKVSGNENSGYKKGALGFVIKSQFS